MARKPTPFDVINPKRGHETVKQVRKTSPYETVSVDRLNSKTLPASVIRIARSKKSETILARVPLKTMARWVVVRGDFYRVSSVSSNPDSGKPNTLKVFCNGVLKLSHETRINNPVGYVVEHPKSKHRVMFVDAIMGSCGLSRADAEKVLLAPMRQF